jgi:hypothetical protein
MREGPDDPTPSLHGAEGQLVSIGITVEPRLLEQLLDVLARLSFPINPQIYHDAAAVYVGPDGSRCTEPVTLVEFPAWAGRVPDIQETLARSGFDRACLGLRDMLDQIQAPTGEEAAPPGARYKAIVRCRRPLRAIA